jgi:hypothetical protein
MELEGNGRQGEVSNVHEKPDLILAACCAASLILVPLLVIGATVVLFLTAVAGETAGHVRGGEAGLVDTRTIAIGLCHGRWLEKPRALSFRNNHP